MGRFLSLSVTLVALFWSHAAFAAVTIHFHSFNGSVFFGRYPHAFVVLDGTLDSTGQKVDENFGFSALKVSPAILRGPVKHTILVEEPEQIARTNDHFSVVLTDAQYHRIRSEVERWRNAPGAYYDLGKRNCIHFVGRMARLAGLRVDYPAKMLRKPRAWLNHIGTLNPQLGATPI